MTNTNDRLYPWPMTADAERAATRESLLRYFLEDGLRAVGRSDELASTSAEHSMNVHQIVGAFTAAHLLREIETHHREDDVARDLVGALNDGGAVGELLWQWAVEEDLDAQAISDTGRAEAKTWPRNGASRVWAERWRQRFDEHYRPADDARWNGDQLARAAAAYLAYGCASLSMGTAARALWPWSEETFKPTPRDGTDTGYWTTVNRDARVRDLEKAGALIAAEIDRLLALECADGDAMAREERR